MKKSNLYIIAGPNGSGKTTFAKEFLPQYVKCPNFINADMIAQGLAPFSPQTVAIKAGRLLLSQIQEYSSKKVDFAFETTLSGKTYATLLKKLKNTGYEVHLFFLWIPNANLALERIKERAEPLVGCIYGKEVLNDVVDSHKILLCRVRLRHRQYARRGCGRRGHLRYNACLILRDQKVGRRSSQAALPDLLLETPEVSSRFSKAPIVSQDHLSASEFPQAHPREQDKNSE